MNIPDCYDPVCQAERREAMLDKQEALRECCGCCGRVIEPGEHIWTVLRHKETFSLCRDCKADVDESETLVPEVTPYDV